MTPVPNSTPMVPGQQADPSGLLMVDRRNGAYRHRGSFIDSQDINVEAVAEPKKTISRGSVLAIVQDEIRKSEDKFHGAEGHSRKDPLVENVENLLGKAFGHVQNTDQQCTCGVLFCVNSDYCRSCGAARPGSKADSKKEPLEVQVDVAAVNKSPGVTRYASAPPLYSTTLPPQSPYTLPPSGAQSVHTPLGRKVRPPPNCSPNIPYACSPVNSSPCMTYAAPPSFCNSVRSPNAIYAPVSPMFASVSARGPLPVQQPTPVMLSAPPADSRQALLPNLASQSAPLATYSSSPMIGHRGGQRSFSFESAATSPPVASQNGNNLRIVNDDQYSETIECTIVRDGYDNFNNEEIFVDSQQAKLSESRVLRNCEKKDEEKGSVYNALGEAFGYAENQTKTGQSETVVLDCAPSSGFVTVNAAPVVYSASPASAALSPPVLQANVICPPSQTFVNAPPSQFTTLPPLPNNRILVSNGNSHKYGDVKQSQCGNVVYTGASLGSVSTAAPASAAVMYSTAGTLAQSNGNLVYSPAAPLSKQLIEVHVSPREPPDQLGDSAAQDSSEKKGESEFIAPAILSSPALGFGLMVMMI